MGGIVCGGAALLEILFLYYVHKGTPYADFEKAGVFSLSVNLCGTLIIRRRRKRKRKKRPSIQLYCHYTQRQDIMKCTLASLRYENMSSVRAQDQKHWVQHR